MKVHFTDPYLLNPQHIITVNLVGLGGTGSQMLGNLGRMNAALKELGHPGLQVCAWDGDEVTEANVGRQLFSAADVGENKARVLVSRINRFFGTSWEAVHQHYTGQRKTNILITCVDTAKARIDIKAAIRNQHGQSCNHPYEIGSYWLDLGNGQKTGQVVLGTYPDAMVRQPKSEHQTVKTLKDVVAMFPGLKKIKEADQGPSCSLAEALKKQDLFINSILAQYGANLLWKLFREGMIRHHGCYVNLDTMIVNPIKIN